MKRVFISHASEDKDSFVRELARVLSEGSLSVWYDEFSLKLGDPLRESIDRGLADCDYGIVVLSKAFFNKSKRWPKDELEGLFSRESQLNRSLILPIWHGVDFDVVADFSPILASRLAADSRHGAQAVASQIVSSIELHNDQLRYREISVKSPGGGEARVSIVPNAMSSMAGFDFDSLDKIMIDSAERFRSLLNEDND